MCLSADKSRLMIAKERLLGLLVEKWCGRQVMLQGVV
jgi:hypothetical protein